MLFVIHFLIARLNHDVQVSAPAHTAFFLPVKMKNQLNDVMASLSFLLNREHKEDQDPMSRSTPTFVGVCANEGQGNPTGTS